MEPCRTCRFASIIHQQCRKSPPVAFPIPTPRGPALFGGFPGLPHEGGCGAHEPCDRAELERRDKDHPVTVREVPDKPRLVT